MTPKLTSAGRNLLLRGLTGETITFTKIQLGNGTAQDPTDATGLVNPIITAEITKIAVGTDYVTLTARFTNGSVTSGFHATEVGFYAEDPDDNTKEILYALGDEDESSADYVPAKDSRILEMQFDALIFIGDAENVSAAISSSLVYASKEDFDAHTENTANPHGVTKQQVGLGNVPNLAPSDQILTFTEAAALSNIESGEKASTLFSKIKLAISKLIGHLNNRSNPHNTTAAQVGAATKSHTHNAQDINAGTLPIHRGGTGATTAADALANLGAAKDTIVKARAEVTNDTELDSVISTWYAAMADNSVSFFEIYVSAPGVILGGGTHILQIYRSGGSYGAVYTYSYQTREKRRVLWDGIWGAWEWEHPDNVVNAEYSTTERYGGKTVYTKIATFQNPVNNASLNPQLGAGAHVIRYGAVTDTSVLPSITSESQYDMWLDVGTSGHFVFRCGSGTSASTLTVQFWYTKA